MNTLTETRRLWRQPTTVQEILSPENQRRQQTRRAIEQRRLTAQIPMNDAEYFEQLWREVE